MSAPQPTPSQGKGHAVPAALQTISTSSSNRTSSHRESLNLNRAPPSPQISANRSSNLTENFRSAPLSPRAHRTPSMSQQAIQDLLNNPPGAKASNPEFDGRDWRTVRVGEIIDRSQVRFAETSTSVEDATKVRNLLSLTCGWY
jgi:hypothetical protein